MLCYPALSVKEDANRREEIGENLMIERPASLISCCREKAYGSLWPHPAV